ncbi:MAG: hypothetical protein HC895_22805 [Leptolyngbyaceae cyanobacterium SM1_3_5]|nr:hypothetical protein [Leptolyngbyaceae cyanobacterium SM1_3_5]
MLTSPCLTAIANLNQSTRKGTRKETIQRSLDPGTYFLRVQQRSGDLRYRLSGSTAAIAPQPSPITLQPSPIDPQPNSIDPQPHPIDPQPDPINPQPNPIDLTSTIEFSQSVYQITEGETTPFILIRTGSTADISQVQIVFSGGSLAVTGFPITITFDPGETTQEIPIESLQNSLRDDPRTANFQLISLSANTIANSDTELQVLDDDRPFNDNGSFNIEFDYRFDSIGWFTPEKKAALEVAANFWENAIEGDFIDASPGLRVPFIVNPETNARIDDFALDRQVDDLVVFMGARGLGGFLGFATRVGGFMGDGYPTFQASYLDTDFKPWLGIVSFDRWTNFFIDTTPETRNDIPLFQYDFISTAIHELGHVLGIGITPAFSNQLNFAGTAFIGENARRLTGNLGIPISFGLDHVQTTFAPSASGTPVMIPLIPLGDRLLPTIFDLAMLDDIGYQVNYGAAFTNSSLSFSQAQTTGRNNATPGFARCGCAGCLMSS